MNMDQLNQLHLRKWFRRLRVTIRQGKADKAAQAALLLGDIIGNGHAGKAVRWCVATRGGWQWKRPQDYYHWCNRDCYRRFCDIQKRSYYPAIKIKSKVKK